MPLCAPASVTFSVLDDGGTAGPGRDIARRTNALTFDLTAIDDAPLLSADRFVATLQ
jgi:hypothetical protein